MFVRSLITKQSNLEKRTVAVEGLNIILEKPNVKICNFHGNDVDQNIRSNLD